jgi:hypothetical protein
MRRLILHALWISVFGMSACAQPERLASDPSIDPRRPSSDRIQLKPLNLTPVVLSSHTDHDRWEHAIIGRSGPSMAYYLYKQLVLHRLADKKKPGYSVYRWLILGYREPLPSQVREELRTLVGRMASQENKDPNIRYLVGLMAWTRLVERPHQTELPTSLDSNSLIDVVVNNWSQLAIDNPNWFGPFGVSSAELAEKAKRLDGNRKRASTVALRAALSNDTYRPAAELSSNELSILEMLDGFHREYEDRGADKACIRVMHAQEKTKELVWLGDALAQCALHENKPEKALAQLERMVDARMPGGFPTLMAQLRAQVTGNDGLAQRLSLFEDRMKNVADQDADYARLCGISSQSGSPSQSP